MEATSTRGAHHAARYTDGTYLENVRDWHLGDAAWKAGKILRLLEAHGLSPGTVADVGCGAGGVLAELQEKLPPTTRFSGFDISPQAIELARKRENERLHFHNEDFLESSEPAPELLLLLDVFEHVPDYLGFLDALRKKTDWVIFHIPLDLCAKELLKGSRYMLHMRQQYGHLHYFSAETALCTLKDTGFDVVDQRFTDDGEMDSEPPPTLKGRAVRWVRQTLFRRKARLAAALFEHFNLLVLARGDLATRNPGPEDRPAG